MSKRIWSFILTVLILVGMMPEGAFAQEAAEPNVITLDFDADAAKGKALTAFTEEADGWAYDSEASFGVSPRFYQHSSWDYSCLRFTQTEVGGTAVLDLTAPVAGKYDMELTYATGNSGNDTVVTVGGTTTAFNAYAKWGTEPRSVKAQGVELTEGSNALTITTAEGKTTKHYLMLIKVVFTQVVEKEPASGLVIDLYAAANSGEPLKNFGVTGTSVTDLGWGFNVSETAPANNATTIFNYNIIPGGTHSNQAPLNEDGTFPGVYFANKPDTIGSTVNFYVPEDGWYRPDLSAVSNQRCGDAAAWVDGKYVGTYAGYGLQEPVITTHSMNTVYLEKGVHKLLLRPTRASDRYSNYYWVYLSKIEFVRMETAQQIGELGFTMKAEKLHIGDSTTYTLTAADTEGTSIYLGEDRDGTANWSFVSSDPEILKIEDGRLYGLKEGTVTLTLTVVLNGKEEVYAETVNVLGEPEPTDFEICFEEGCRPEKAVGQINIEDDGWDCVGATSVWFSDHANETSIYGKFMSFVYKQLTTTEPQNYLGIEFKAPATGSYRVEIDHILRSICGETHVYLDGEFIGAYDGYGENWKLASDSLSVVQLERNKTYRLTFRCVIPGGAEYKYTFLNKIRFVVDDAEPKPVDRLVMSLNRVSMAVGEDCAYAISAFDSQDRLLPVGLPLEGYTSKYLTVEVDDADVVELNGSRLVAKAPGCAQITATVNYGGNTVSETKTVEVNGDVLKTVDFYLPQTDLTVGQTVQAGYTAKTDSGRTIKPQYLETIHISSDDSVVTIDENGLVTAVSEGGADLTVAVSLAEVTVESTIHVTVAPKQGKISVSNPEGAMSMHPDDEDGIELLITGVDAEGNELDLTTAEIAYEIGKDGIIEITDGRALPLALGNTTVYITVTMADGTVYETNTWVSVNRGKIAPTYYTYEKREAAVSNALKYDWGHQLKAEAIRFADYVIAHLDEYYDLMTFEGIPRTDNPGMNEDPQNFNCPICHVDTIEFYGQHYGWITDPIEDPWKISCPACKSRFPSNDFESYYKSGLDAQGVFHKENADPQYLVNELYPEKGEGWGVDDGWGWYTGEYYTNDAGGKSPRVYAFAAYYNSQGIWQGMGNSPKSVRKALNSLVDAYLYTGDMKYGRAGAILIDRVADIYPTMNMTEAVYQLPRDETFYRTASNLPEGVLPYNNNHGTYCQGKIAGCIAEGNLVAKTFVKAYDAFYPAFDDPEVVSYLAARAEQQELAVNGENPKDTPYELRENGIYGILHEVSEGVRNRDIWGNFGLGQSSMALAAVVLDTTEQLSEPAEEYLGMPTGERRLMNSNEMIAWLFEVGCYNHGPTLDQIVSTISRDGHGDEVSPQYHATWMNNLVDFADALHGYEGYPEADLYKNPKFIKMLIGNLYLTAGGNTTLQNGDSGTAGGIRVYLNKDTLARAFAATGSVEIAQALYFLNGETTKGLVGSIFDPDANKFAAKVQAIIDRYGPYDVNASVLLPGYGQALLKWGDRFDEDQGLYSLWFGRLAGAHGNRNALDYNIFAYGINMSPSLGYPRTANDDLVRHQWERGTVSRNTVVIDDTSQINFSHLDQYVNTEPYHYEDAGRVKVADAEAVKAYEGTADTYRRTLVTVQGDDDAYYAVDFFHVIGGSTHLYSFHAAALDYPESDGVQTVKQKGGTYAGENVPFAADQANGYSYLYDVERDDDPENDFYLDYTIYDHKHVLVDGYGLHLRLNMLSTEEEPVTEVSYAKGRPPVKEGNPDHYPYALIRKDGGNNLFTAVIEPYKHSRYLDTMELVDVEVVEGKLYADDRAAAVKVYRTDGKVDYIVYCTNYDAVLRVDDRFEFSGFVGVVTYTSADESAYICYRYGMEATYVAGELLEHKTVTGKVLDFNRDLSYENYITVTVDQDIDPEMLVGRVMYVQTDGEQNGAYTIKGVSVDGDRVTFDLGDQHLVRTMKDPADVLGGYIMNIAVGQSFRIPMSASDDTMLFVDIADHVVKAGNKVSITTGIADPGVTYEAEGLPSTAKFNEADGTVAWTTSKSQTGRYPITVKAIDAEGEVKATVSFTIYVVGYSGSAYDASVCKHAKAVVYTVDSRIETVCPACGTITKTEAADEIRKFVFAGSNMTLGNELEQNFMVSTSDLKEGYKALITHNGETVEAEFGKYNSTYSRVSFSVAAKEMADPIEVVVVDADGNAVSEVYTSSVRDYAMKALVASTSSAKVKTMVVDMLNYGAAAQTYFGYNTEDLANAKLTDVQKSWATDDVSCTDRRVQGKNYYGSNLSLEDKILLNLYFKNCTADMTAKVTFKDHKGKTVTADAELKKYSGKIYKVEVDEVVLADAFCDVTVTVYDGETVFASATDSVESYVARSEGSDLYVSILKFAASAMAYFS